MEMRDDGTGTWTVTTQSLRPDLYDYGFIVDNVRIADPANPRAATILGRGPFSLVNVPGESSTPWDLHAIPHGVISHHSYESPIVQGSRDYYVYTPPSYDPRRRNPYPVLYLLHGVDMDSKSWIDLGAAPIILDNLIAQGKATPMVVVMPNGYGSSALLKKGPSALASLDVAMSNTQLFERMLLEEVAPSVERRYRVSNRAGNEPSPDCRWEVRRRSTQA
jgi:enterochelin esterase family protein